jgi:hypothetical protein
MSFLHADDGMPEIDRLDFGFHVSFGWKQDNLRLTTSANGLERTGTTGDISFDTRYSLSQAWALILNLPVGRPVLFGAAFSFLQLEPQLTLECYKRLYEGLELVMGPALGASFYYGPEAGADIDALNSSEFLFVTGPMVSTLVGLRFHEFFESVFGFRSFYGGLLAEARDYGEFYGGLVEYYIYFD